MVSCKKDHFAMLVARVAERQCVIKISYVLLNGSVHIDWNLNIAS
jgi:hypothetical protein